MAQSSILSSIKGALIVSCQADSGDPLDDTGILVASARAAANGGARGIRAEGPGTIRAMKARIDLPLIGIYKRRYGDSPVFITPTLADALAVAEAGADIVAMDATDRPRPGGEMLEGVVSALRARTSTLLMADVSTLAEGVKAAVLGFDLIATTLSGYTEDTHGSATLGPDVELVAALCAELRGGIPVIAEGRIAHPAQAVEALRRGAYAVVVGTAITRPAALTRSYVRQIERFHALQQSVAIGVDLGATRTALAVVDYSGTIHGRKSCGSPWARGMAAVVEMLGAGIGELMNAGAGRIKAIGIAASGRVDSHKGVVKGGVPLAKDYFGYPLAAAVESALQAPVYLENDANAAAYAAYRALGVPPRTMVLITIGTGIGGGIILDGSLYRGRGSGGEIGHICIDPRGRACPCGRRGCLERYVSRSRMQRQVELLVKRGEIALPEGSQAVDSDSLIALIRSRHPAVMAIFERQMEYLACALETLVNILDPDLFVLGGEIASLGEPLSRALSERLTHRVPVITTLLANDAGTIGAALLALEKLYSYP